MTQPSIIGPGATTFAQAQSTLDAQMGSLLQSGNPIDIVTNVASLVSPAMAAIDGVGPAVPDNIRSSVLGLVQVIANAATNDTAGVIGNAQLLYNALQSALNAIGAPTPTQRPDVLRWAIINFFRVYGAVGCAPNLGTMTGALQDAMVISPNYVQISGYTRGVYDDATATALQSLVQGLTSAPAACPTTQVMVPASIPATAPTPATTPVTSPAPATAAASTSSNTALWVVGGAVVTISLVALLLSRK